MASVVPSAKLPTPVSADDTFSMVVAQLPFQLTDIDQINATFQHWQAQGDEASARVVALWTYCYVRRYFLIKFMRQPAYRASDFDGLIDKAYRKIEKNRDTLRNPDRYAHWVSVVCKNTLLNYLRSPRWHVSISEEHDTALAAPAPEVQLDHRRLHKAVQAAIMRLPVFLQEVAQLRFVENRSYEEISVAIGKPVPTARAYVNKAVKRFRQDRCLLCFVGH